MSPIKLTKEQIADGQGCWKKIAKCQCKIGYAPDERCSNCFWIMEFEDSDFRMSFCLCARKEN